ncbi:tRNA (adenine(22)-N(1))-methyltransferase [Peptoniphilus asaccharolyticus]
MRLSNRLETIAMMVSKNSKVADIGTDHGQVPIFLSENNISNYIVCSDISEPSLRKSEEIVKSFNNIYPRLGDGLNVLEKNEVDEVIIAGMGGHLIVKILEENLEIIRNLKSLILQPMQGTEYLREYLYEKYKFIDEKIVYEDSRYFEIIQVVYTGEKTSVDEIYFEIPKVSYDKKEKICTEFINHKIQKNKDIIENIKKSKTENNKIDFIKSKNDRLQRLL